MRNGTGMIASRNTDKEEIRDAASSSPFEGVSPIGAVAMETSAANPAGGVHSDAVAGETPVASSAPGEAKHPGAVNVTASSTSHNRTHESSATLIFSSVVFNLLEPLDHNLAF